MYRSATLTLSLLLLWGCTEASGQDGSAAQNAAAGQAAPPNLPVGRYLLDPSHASLAFKVKHLGLANYVARFKKFDAALELDPANLAATSLTATVDTSSVETDYPGDYKRPIPTSLMRAGTRISPAIRASSTSASIRRRPSVRRGWSRPAQARPESMAISPCSARRSR